MEDLVIAWSSDHLGKPIPPVSNIGPIIWLEAYCIKCKCFGWFITISFALQSQIEMLPTTMLQAKKCKASIPSVLTLGQSYRVDNVSFVNTDVCL